MEVSLTIFYPTLVQCFGIILLGYIAGRCNWLTISEGKGICLFVSYVALPALLFKAMVEVDFSKINWLLWSGILISKLIMFMIAILLSLLFHKHDKLGNAGIYGIFVTQSNDFAFGLPILQGIFNDPSKKYLLDYVYLVAPISLAFLNPLGFSLLEYNDAKNNINSISTGSSIEIENSRQRISVKHIALETSKKIITNPLVFMILFGIIGNFVLQNQIPNLILNLFTALGNAFAPTALFYLGWSLGNSKAKVKLFGILIPTFLVAGKNIILPVIMHQIVAATISSNSSYSINTNHTGNVTYDSYIDDASTFAFFYGAIPTAPTVLMFAGRYRLAENVIGMGLVFGTVISAPIIFASVKVLEIKNMIDVTMFTTLICHVHADVSILTIIGATWAIGVFVLLRLYRRKLHSYTIMLFINQTILSVAGLVFNNYVGTSSNVFSKVTSWILLTSLFSCYCWLTVVAVFLSFRTKLHTRMNKRCSYIAFTYGIGVPASLSTLLLFLSPNIIESARNQKHFFLSCVFKTYVMFFLNLFTIITILISLMKLNAATLYVKPCYFNIDSVDNENDIGASNSLSIEIMNTEKVDTDNKAVENKFCEACPLSDTVRSLSEKKGYGRCTDVENRYKSKCLINQTLNVTNSSEKEKDVSYLYTIDELEEILMRSYLFADRFHATNHVILILLMLFTMIMNLILCVLHFNDHMQGIYLEIELLCVICTYGQGFISFAVFGFLKEIFILPIFSRMKRSINKCFNMNKVQQKDITQLEPHVIKLCQKFQKHHLQNCTEEVASIFRFHYKLYENAFKGTTLVNWLLENGLVKDRIEAVEYSNHLLLGGIICHATKSYSFYDLPYIYQFILK